VLGSHSSTVKKKKKKKERRKGLFWLTVSEVFGSWPVGHVDFGLIMAGECGRGRYSYHGGQEAEWR
jgi:hypothetical protein